MLIFLILSISKAISLTSERKISIWDELKKKRHATELFFNLTLHYLIIFVVVLFSIGYLALRLQTNYLSGVLALLSACVGYIIPGSKTWTKNYTNPHCFISVAGPGGCGRTYLVSKILLNQKKNIFNPSFERILYLYKHFQPHYQSLLLGCTRKKITIEFHKGLEWAAVQETEAANWRTLVVIDDLYQDSCEDATFLNLVVAGRHRDIHLMPLRHNLYQSAKNSKTIDLSVTQMILFKNDRDVEQFGVLGRQLGDIKLLLEAYKRATYKQFGHLVKDLDPQTHPRLKYCSNCIGSQPTVFDISTN